MDATLQLNIVTAIKQFVNQNANGQLNNEELGLVCARANAEVKFGETTKISWNGQDVDAYVVNIAAKQSSLSSEIVDGVQYDKLHMETIALVVDDTNVTVVKRSYDAYSKDDDEMFVKNEVLESANDVDTTEYRFYK